MWKVFWDYYIIGKAQTKRIIRYKGTAQRFVLGHRQV